MSVIREDKEFLDVHFPKAGIDLLRAFDKQQPRPISFGPPKQAGLPPTPQEYSRTCPVGKNVRGFDPATNRSRGGARPGLVKYLPVTVAGTRWIVQDLNVIVTDGGGGGPITFIQTNYTRATTGSPSASVAFTSPVEAGNLIVVAFSVYGNSSLASVVVSDTLSNTYNLATTQSGLTDATAIFYAVSGASGSCTITVGVPDYCSACIIEYSGAEAVIDDSGDYNSTTSWSTGSIPVTGTDRLVLGVFATGFDDEVVTVPGAYNTRVNATDDIANFEGIVVVDEIVSEATDFALTATDTFPWCASGVSFR